MLIVLVGLGVISGSLSAQELSAQESSQADENETPPPEGNYLFRAVRLHGSQEITTPKQLEMIRQGLLAFGIFGLCGLLVVRRLVMAEAFRALKRAEKSEDSANPQEDPSLASFFAALRDGLYAPVPALDTGGQQTSDAESAAGASLSTQEFFDSAPRQLAGLQALFSQIGRASDKVARHNILLELLDEVGCLKNRCHLPELRPLWVIACAFEGLLRELTKNAVNITPSSLGTAAGAVDLLRNLCVPGVRPNLLAEPPIRILAVDDDPVSRLAISFALKKAFKDCDLAPEGETALGLAAKQAYDVIFLDVEMPGMDGFELCTRIHETACNRKTPAVFVTRHSDFNSRAKSSLSGGHDLIAKPFLVFEITVKALTLALRARLQKSATEPQPTLNEFASSKVPEQTAFASEASATIVAPVSTTESAGATEQDSLHAETQTGTSIDRDSRALVPPASKGTPTTTQELPAQKATASTTPSREECEDAFFLVLPEYLTELHRQLQAVKCAAEPAALQRTLSELYASVQTVRLDAERAELCVVSRLCSTLEGMLKKLMGHTKLCTPSTLEAAAIALDLLKQLSEHDGPDPSLDNPPVRILVVDDDPIACRAISGSVQLVFGRPDSADSGETALVFADEKSFDLIFLDVLMPGIDGYAACKKIHETLSNRHTPVVFITSHDDADSRVKAADVGVSGFIPKPVLASQITLTALTYTLRARLKSLETAPAVEEKACLELA